jgi:hypothetical protein
MHLKPEISLPKLISIKKLFIYVYLILGQTDGIFFAPTVFDRQSDRAEVFVSIS